jgi:hypothetical protein
MRSVGILLYLNCLNVNILGRKFTFESLGKYEFSFSGVRPGVATTTFQGKTRGCLCSFKLLMMGMEAPETC